ncbi:MAG: glycoside hydrolase family 65 protein [Anaerolineae bacterium]|nr:glycoside hydrolase family 65 protein [Anaerolineae bacterium]
MDSTWVVHEDTFEAERQHHSETIFTIGNGYLGTRGTFEERYPGDRQATLIHGVFDDAPIIHTELVNAPDWLPFSLFVEGQRFAMNHGLVTNYLRTLHLRTGLLTRQLRWRSPGGQSVDITIERWASLADEHLLAIRYTVTALNFSGEIELRAGLDGLVENPCAIQSNMGLLHWQRMTQGYPAPQIATLHSRTRTSGIDLCQAVYLTVEGVENVSYAPHDCPNCPQVIARFHLAQGQTATATKLVTMYTSRDISNPAAAVLEKLAEAIARGYDALWAEHVREWDEYWRVCDVVIEGDDEAQLALRFSLFQLLIATPRHDDRVSIPAKTLSGFDYRGHVFWDTDIFIVPFLAFTLPHLARNLLMYRYHTLPGARDKARRAGYQGAMYPWESVPSGEETTPHWVPLADGRVVRIWCGEIEQHISADVAYAVWRYWQVTGDEDFFVNYGAEIILDTAVFWGSRVEFNGREDRYEINDVIGPDENHEHVNNSVFTNRMVQWHLRTALHTLSWLQETHPDKASELAQRLHLTPERLVHWQDVIDRIYIAQNTETGLMEQFDGFFDLEDLDLTSLEPRTQSVQGLLGIEGAQKVQVLKQPDVLMLLYMLDDEYDQATKRVNWDYYEPRTDHAFGSSLGPAVHAILGCQLGEIERAYEHFMRAARADLHDVRGNADAGIHAASAGGLWQAVIFGFAGLKLTPQGPIVHPRLPSHWKKLSFTIRYRGETRQYSLES